MFTSIFGRNWKEPHNLPFIAIFIVATTLNPQLFPIASFPHPVVVADVCHLFDLTCYLFFRTVANARFSFASTLDANYVKTIVIVMATIVSESTYEFWIFFLWLFVVKLLNFNITTFTIGTAIIQASTVVVLEVCCSVVILRS